MNPGRTNKWVTLQQSGGLPDGADGVTSSYTDVATVRDELEPLTEQEVVAAQHVEAPDPPCDHVVSAGVREDMRFVFEGRALDWLGRSLLATYPVSRFQSNHSFQARLDTRVYKPICPLSPLFAEYLLRAQVPYPLVLRKRRKWKKTDGVTFGTGDSGPTP